MSKHILIIGGNSGIGETLNTLLLDSGYQTTTVSRSADGLDTTEENPAFKEINGQIDGLVYCPGSILLKPFKGLKIADFENDIQVNYLGAVKAIKHYYAQLNEGASIVLFSSVAVQKGMPFHSSISGAKGAVEGLTRALAAEFAPKIRVNCIAPSLTDTPLAEKLLRNDRLRENAAERHPLKSVGTPEDIASMAQFLLSDQARWISGQVMKVDGGMSSLATGS